MSPTGETIPIASDHAGIEMKDRLVAELKKMGYQPDDIARWASLIAEKTAECKEVFVYFKHEEEGKGPEFAKLLMQHLQIA